ncbi:MAG: hypothetical protein WC329_01525 [Candidatus Omnitrophota bacterium]|jgi:hypothetical protein
MKNKFFGFLARRKQAAAAKTPPVPACPFPGCGVPFAPDPKRPDACERHRQLITDFGFIMAHLKTVEAPKESLKKVDIIVPKGFRQPPTKGG